LSRSSAVVMLGILTRSEPGGQRWGGATVLRKARAGGHWRPQPTATTLCGRRLLALTHRRLLLDGIRAYHRLHERNGYGVRRPATSALCRRTYAGCLAAFRKLLVGWTYNHRGRSRWRAGDGGRWCDWHGRFGWRFGPAARRRCDQGRDPS
jgi:hypothetical protein